MNCTLMIIYGCSCFCSAHMLCFCQYCISVGEDRKLFAVLLICNSLSFYCPSIQAQLSKAQEETGALKLQLQTVRIHIHIHIHTLNTHTRDLFSLMCRQMHNTDFFYSLTYLTVVNLNSYSTSTLQQKHTYNILYIY